jgi:hypothetical protein
MNELKTWRIIIQKSCCLFQNTVYHNGLLKFKEIYAENKVLEKDILLILPFGIRYNIYNSNTKQETKRR